MSDLIKRDDAIKAIECRFNADLMDRIDAMLMTSAIAQITKNIANIPSADKQGEWIPCSERLPEEEGMFLVSVKKRAWDGNYMDVEIAYCSPNHRWFNVSNGEVLAWMPLPPAWKGADNE